MTCMLIDDWVYMDVDGKVGVYGRQEVDRNFKSKFKEVKVSFLNYETKVLSLSEKRSPYQEALINSAFDDGYMMTQERLSSDLVQVIAAKKETIEEIYQHLNPVTIDSFVPYAVAVRAFLKSQDLLSPAKCTIFLDDLRNQTLLTVFEDGCFTSPRRISMRDDNYMISEIKRSWQNYILTRTNKSLSTDMSFTVVSNNQEWLSSFVQQGFVSKEDVTLIKVDFAVLEGLKSAKFAIHFAPVKEILRKKRNQLWKDRLKVFIVSLVVVVLGVGFYSVTRMYQQKTQQQYKNLKDRTASLEIKAKDIYRQKFLSFLLEEEPISYGKTYYDFIRSMPLGYALDKMSFQRRHEDVFFQGDIYPKDEYALQDQAALQSSFVRADISAIILHKSLGHRVTLKVYRKDAE
jgi:hypothetical protein